MIANYYKAYLNTDAIDRAGLNPAKADLDEIAKIADKHQLSSAIGATLRSDTDPLNATNFPTREPVRNFCDAGPGDARRAIALYHAGRPGVARRPILSVGRSKMADMRNKYKPYVQTILQDAGYPDPQGAAGRIMDLETKIAKAHEPREQSEDFKYGAQVWTRQQLEQKAPGIDWAALLGAAGLGSVQKFDAYHFAAIPKLSALVASEPLQNWKDWLAFHTINQQANVLPKPFRDASFAFYGTTCRALQSSVREMRWR